MPLVNAIEPIVEERLNTFLKDYDCCKCDKCVMDMMALALNNIKPAYVNTEKGVLFTRINNTKMQATTDIDVAVIRAIELVSSSPHH